MKKLSVALIVVLLLIIGYLLLTKPAVAPVVEPENIPVSETLADTNSEHDTVTESAEVENIVVNTDSLGDGQQKMLKTFGVEGDIEITPAMIACAEEKIGQERVAEIVEGATPSFMEGVSLASCY